ncbi:Homeobox-leucine zipper protein HDG7 [Linum perenne]
MSQDPSTITDESGRVCYDYVEKELNRSRGGGGDRVECLNFLVAPCLEEESVRVLDEGRYKENWDFLINGGSLEEVVRIPKAQTLGNSVSIIRVAQNNYSDDTGTSFILQETWNDATSSLLVYAAVDAPVLELAMSGGDSSFVALMPSGFTIFPDGKGCSGRGNGASTDIGGGGEGR